MNYREWAAVIMLGFLFLLGVGIVMVALVIVAAFVPGALP